MTIAVAAGLGADARGRRRSRSCPAGRCRAGSRRAGSAATASMRLGAVVRDARPRGRRARSSMASVSAPSALSSTTGRGGARSRRRAARPRLRSAGGASSSAPAARTVNSLPLSGAVALRLDRAAVQLARARCASARPMPSPPCARSSARSTCAEHVEDVRQVLRGDADAVVPHARPPRSRRRRSAVSRMCPPGSACTCAALLSRLANTCARRAGSASSAHRLRRQRHREVVARASISGRAVSTRAARTTLASSTRSRRSSSLPLRDAADVEQVVDQAHHVLQLALDDVARRAARAGRRSPARRSSSSALRIGASGLRSSCASVARNSSLRRSRLAQLGVCALQRFLRVLELIEVRADRRPCGDLACLVADGEGVPQGVDRRAGGEAAKAHFARPVALAQKGGHRLRLDARLVLRPEIVHDVRLGDVAALEPHHAPARLVHVERHHVRRAQADEIAARLDHRRERAQLGFRALPRRDVLEIHRRRRRSEAGSRSPRTRPCSARSRSSIRSGCRLAFTRWYMRSTGVPIACGNASCQVLPRTSSRRRPAMRSAAAFMYVMRQSPS